MWVRVPSTRYVRSHGSLSLARARRDVWSFHFQNDAWNQVSSGGGSGSPEPRSSHSCALVHEEGATGQRTGTVLVFGGLATSRRSACTCDCSGARWREVARSGEEWREVAQNGVQ